MLVNIALFALLGIGDNTPGHGTCNLAYKDILTVRCGNHDIGMFVLFTGLRKPCLVVVAVLVVYEFDLSVHGEPVGMNVQWTHEDADHQTFVVEIFVFLSLFQHHNLTIGRSNHQFVCVTVEIADRTAVEIQHG